MDQALMENDLDTTSCMQKMVCYTVRESSNKVSNGLASSKDKIIDGIVTNEWISKLFDGTPVQSAIRSGLDGVNCSNEYSLCKLEQKTFANLVRQFANTINLT
ncbi:hypothetical protein PPYR_14724 [Photinus pyralis]|uniref:Uncharacterized protein n=2 Tax=Photinus pyralis TaxID=7054 RepID=A0A5N4A622_PHOPY|nr:hypothetical protein PPYR_14724 [Photinus pyralis]